MKTQQSITLAFALASTALVSVPAASAQDMDIQVAAPQAFKFMDEGKWEEAQSILAKIVEIYQTRAKNFGGKFGVLYYNKGRCELKIAAKLKQAGGKENMEKAATYYSMAVESFDNCYKYPSNERGNNVFHKLSILLKGQALQDFEKYPEAIQAYQKFMTEREPTDKFNPGVLNIGLAICYFNLDKPDLANGIKHFETTLQNKDAWKMPDASIVIAFRALTHAVIVTKKEQALIDFLNQNRAAITLEPHQMVEFSPFFQKLASEALENDMLYATYNLLALVPGTKVAISDITALSQKLENYPKKSITDGYELIDKDRLKANLEKLRTMDRGGDPSEVLALRVQAYTHQSNLNPRAAFACYEQLELYFNKSKNREDNLYNLVHTSSMIGEVMLTEQYGSVFLRDFPESSRAESVRGLMLISLFTAGEYEKCLEVAQKLIDTLKPDTRDHDVCLHVLGGSLFYLGRYVDAHPQLINHVKRYPKSDYKVSARYFEASNLSRLQMWAPAAIKLDAFLKDYPTAKENMFLPFALYDRATVHFAEGEKEEALANLDRVEKEFPGSNIEDMAFNLKGNILQVLGQRDKAKEYYVKALELAEHRDNTTVAAESLYYLVSLLGVDKLDNEVNPNLKDAVPFYDKFWKEHQDSAYKAQVADAGMVALSAAGRGDEALKNLQATISEMGKSPNPAGLDQAIGSYTKYWLLDKKAKKVSDVDAAEQLKKHYYDFPDVEPNDVRTLAMLRIAIIGVFEENLKKAISDKDQARITANEASIKVLFEELKRDYPVEKLSDFVLVRIGDYLRKNSAAPRQALPYYEERLKRPSVNGRSLAQFGIADVLGRSDAAADQDKAIATLNEVIKDNKDDVTTLGDASYRLCEIYAKRGDWAKLSEIAKQHLKDYTKETPRVSYLLALSYDKQNMYDKAMGAYAQCYGAYEINPDISIPSMNRLSELKWEHAKDADGKSGKQQAYDMAAQYIESSRAGFTKVKEELADDTREAWLATEQRVKTMEASGQIKTLAEQEEEANK